MAIMNRPAHSVPRFEWPPIQAGDPLRDAHRQCPDCGFVLFLSTPLPDFDADTRVWKCLPLSAEDLQKGAWRRYGLRCPNACQAGQWHWAPGRKLAR